MIDFHELDILGSPIEPGLTVIEASAGTGKTYSISHLVPRLLLQGSLPDLSKLLLVTFTKDAARELSDRVRKVLSELAAPALPDEAQKRPHISGLRAQFNTPEHRARLDQGLLDLDLLSVSTIHSFCQRTLKQEGSLCGLPILPDVTTDDREQLTPIVRDLWMDTLARDPLLAALATARGWSLENALDVIATMRRAHLPTPEPAVPDFDIQRASLESLCKSLEDSTLLDSATNILRRVKTWNKGVVDSDEAIARLKTLQQSKTSELTYWQVLGKVAELPSKIGARSNEGKGLKKEAGEHRFFSTLEDLSDVIVRLEWAWQQHLASRALPKLADLMAQHRLITQDGLIGALHHALHRTGPIGEGQSARLAAHLAERYHVALIDEAQDTDPRQLAIFQRIFLDPAHKRRLILVGDPKQAIYGFRGADLEAYLAARSRADAGYTLIHTYRAPSPLVTAVNALFSRPGAFHHREMLYSEAISALPHDRQLTIDGKACRRFEFWIPSAEQETEFSAKRRREKTLSERIATTIVGLLARGELHTTFADGRPAETKPVGAGDCAILVATNSQAEQMAEALLSRGVPAVVNSGADVFASDEARELHTILSAVLDPRKTRRLRTALATRMLGLDAAALSALDAPAPDGESGSARWQAQFLRWNEHWERHGLAAFLAALDQMEVPILRRLAMIPLTGERRATNYRHLTDLLLAADRNEATLPADICHWLGQRIAQAEARSFVEEHQLQLASDRAAVQVVTMHKAKGLEYPLVFCPYLAASLRTPAGVVHLPSATARADGGRADLLVNFGLLDDTAKAERNLQQMAARLEEQLRLAYVAITRAQVHVWCCSYTPSVKKDYNRGSALDWLLRTQADIAAYASYSDAFADAAANDRSTRHTQALRELLAEHAERATGTPLAITFRAPPEADMVRYQGTGAAEVVQPVLTARSSPPIPPSWRVTSFSTLTREKHIHGAPGAAASNVFADAGSPPLANDPDTAPLFLQAPSGTAVGTVVHEWIESWDIGPVDATALARHLAIARLPAPESGVGPWQEILEDLFTRLRTIRLPGCDTVPLHDLCPQAHGSEWHFHLPLAGELTVGALARCFAEHAAPDHRAYAPLLAELPEERFRGLLQGFIDRLVRHGPNWGVIDWKTNRLGATLDDYDDRELLRCAMESHYLLQTHLYLVALRRYLRVFGAASTSLSGAWLVFLRAIAPDSARGVLHINPPPAMLDALDSLFAPAATTVT